MDTDRIKRRIRGLLNLAGDASAAEGEIDNAMRMAAEMMQAHHLTEADCVAAEPTRAAPEMGTADGFAIGARLSTWESALAFAIETLVGSVKCYRTHADRPQGSFGKPNHGPVIRFYGNAEDSQLAAALFTEWALTIGTLAVGKYGGCYKGDGAMYAYGFAGQLQSRAKEASKAREVVITESTRALVKTSGGSLAQVLKQNRELAASWLRDVKGVKLGSGGSRSGYSAGSHDAYGAGRRDGSRAEFSAKRTAKLTGR